MKYTAIAMVTQKMFKNETIFMCVENHPGNPRKAKKSSFLGKY